MIVLGSLRNRMRLHLIVGLLMLMGSAQSYCANLAPQDLIRQMGLKSLNEAPIDFSLEEIQTGQHRSLKEYRGKWVWLLFWATWCPVCVRELPSITHLASAMKDLGLVVVSVSVDQDRSQLKDYVTKNQLPFPVLFDGQGTVARKYKASGVPTLYIISPDEKVVGLARGALNWDRPGVHSAVQELLKFKEVAGSSSLAAGDAQSTTLKELTPPEITVVSPSHPVEPDQWSRFDIQIRWPGPSHLYQIRTPKLTLPNGVEQGSMSSSTSSELGESLLKFQIPLRFKEAGRFHVGPVDLTYLPRGEDAISEQTTRHPGAEIEILETNQLSKWQQFVAGGAVGGLIILGAALFWFRKRKRSQFEEDLKTSLSSQKSHWEKLYQRAREGRLQGSTKEYGFHLLTLYEEMSKRGERFRDSPHEVDFIQRLSQSQDQLRYGGKEFSENDLRRMEKIIESVLQPDPG